MGKHRWVEAVALVRQAPELLVDEETLAHAESAPLLESVFSSAPGTYQQLSGSTARVAQALSEAGSALAAVELGRRPLREEDVQSLARVAGERELQVRSACRYCARCCRAEYIRGISRDNRELHEQLGFLSLSL